MSRHAHCFALALLVIAPIARASDAPNADPAANRVEATDQSATVELPSGTRLELAPGTVLKRERGVRLDLGGRAGLVPVRVYRLERGDVEVSFREAGSAEALMIRAPRRVSAVARVGRYRVVAADAGTSVAALEQETLAAIGADWKPLSAGHARSIGGVVVPPIRALLPAPSASPGPVAVALDGGASAELSWAPVAGATSYVVNVQSRGASGAPLIRIASKDTGAKLGPLPPGQYEARVAARDAYDLPGIASAPVPIRIVGLELPQGAHADAERIWLGTRQRARLLDGEGLELTYGNATHFVPAPHTVGLSRGEPTVVRLRAKGDPREVRFQLLPMSIAASVQLGPQRARWPEDRVRATVRIDARGTTAPRVTPVVTVNGEPAVVQWTRDGDVLRAVVPPADADGPWVVRVEVPGPGGKSLGRGFLEVAPSRKRLVVGTR